MNRQSYRQRLADMLLRRDTFSAPRNSAGPDHDHYNPNQPRVPAGHSDGGQWTRGGGFGRITPKSTPVMHDLSGQETWKTVATDRRPDGSIAEQLIVNRDGSRIRSQYAPLGANAGWDERHTVMTPDGQIVTFENSGLTQTIYDGQGRKLSQTVMTKDGAEPEAFVQQAFLGPAAPVAQAIVQGALILFAWRASREGLDQKTMLAFSANEFRRGAKAGVPAVWVGGVTTEDAGKVCRKYERVQQFTDDAADSVNRANFVSQATYGTAVHELVKEKVNGPNSPPNPPRDLNFRAELSLLKGMEEGYGKKGTIRIDVYENPRNGAVCVYDIKTGASGLSVARYTELATQASIFYPGAQRIIVIQVRPTR